MLFEIGLRVVMQDAGRKIKGYHFSGEWDKQDRKVVEKVISKHVPAEADPMFNNWTLLCTGGVYLAWKATWETYTLSARTPEQLAEKIEGCFKGK